MEGGKVCNDSNMTVVLQNKRVPCSSEVLDSLWISNSSPSFHGDSGSGSTSMVNVENFQVGNNTDGSFFPPLDKEDNGNEDYDDCFHQPGKKRRLTCDQVRFLEKNFEVENKLEPDRKVQLAKELGLQPRQVAIWFQNRRARFKTKQLEKDYDSLKSSFDKLKSDYECLLKEKEILKNEVLQLTEKLLLREQEKENSEPFDQPIKQMDLEPRKPISNDVSENKSNEPMLVFKQEDASSAKSDVFDSDSPYRDANRSSILEPADSSHVFGPDHSDFDEEDNVSKSFLPLPCLLKLEDSCYDDPPLNSCFLNFQVEEQPSWLWPY